MAPGPAAVKVQVMPCQCSSGCLLCLESYCQESRSWWGGEKRGWGGGAVCSRSLQVLCCEHRAEASRAPQSKAKPKSNLQGMPLSMKTSDNPGSPRANY